MMRWMAILPNARPFGLVFLWQLCCGLALAVPPPKVAPQYRVLKDLHLRTFLVKDGEPRAALIIDDRGELQEEAAAIQQAIKEKTGASLPILKGSDPSLAIPFQSNLVFLGNRSTNSAFSKLYDRFYALTDVKYPGPGGYELRSVHNPFGNARNMILLGGSDAAGVKTAAAHFLKVLNREVKEKGELSVGWLLDVKPGGSWAPASHVSEELTWDDSKGYGSNYFGWNSISKAMALYYTTGEALYAREVVRLSFPDAQAKAEIAKNDGERIENKADPLAGPYHYTATCLVLYWDLIEESPHFSDAEKLAITNGLARQLNHAPTSGAEKVYNLQGPEEAISSRHGIYQALTFYTLSRYFSKDYADPVWQHLLKASGAYYFAPLADAEPWVTGEGDNLYWYSTCLAPLIDYMLLSGDRQFQTSGGLAHLLRNQEVLWNGSREDRNFSFVSPGFLNKAAYVTGDGRWLYYFQRLGLDLSKSRLGQSFWPSPEFVEALPDDLLDRWTICSLPDKQARTLESGISPKESFANMAFRTSPDESGDFILLDGWDSRARNPYHAFSILDLRINGNTLLRGYLNQVQVTVGGAVGAKIPLSARRQEQLSLGGTVLVRAEVPGLVDGASWQRTLCLRKGRHAVVADTITFPKEAENVEIKFLWQNLDGPPWASGPGWTRSDSTVVVAADPLLAESGEAGYASLRNRVAQSWFGDVRQDRQLHFFSLLCPAEGGARPEGIRVAPNAAEFSLPAKVIAATGDDLGTEADFSLREQNHLFATGLKTAPGFTASSPVDIDWDFEKGELAIRAEEATRITVALKAGETPVLLNGQPLDGRGIDIPISEGTHLLSNAFPKAGHSFETRSGIDSVAVSAISKMGEFPELRTVFEVELPGEIKDAAWCFREKEARYFAAVGKTVYELDEGGKTVRQLAAPAEVRTMHWWDEPSLLVLGTMDQQVVAYSLDGRKEWSFQSEMDPAVLKRGKTYWFNTAEAHRGISGLGSGVFLAGESQLFVGSASTLEILDASGSLVKRFAQFWGDPSVFQIIPSRPGGSNLLVGRIHGESLVPYQINSKTLVCEKGRFHEPPPDHTYFKQWNGLRRMHFFHADIDGDGKREVISDIVGFWNRISVWDEEGKPKASISFGPGAFPGGSVKHTSSLIRGAGLVSAGPGESEPKVIVAVLSTGLAVALDGQCQIKWSKKLPFTPTALAVSEGTVAIGGEDGRVITLDFDGRFLQEASLPGKIDFLTEAMPGTFLAVSGKILACYAIGAPTR